MEEIEITTLDGGKFKLSTVLGPKEIYNPGKGPICGHLVIDQSKVPVRGRWAITHKPTGMAVTLSLWARKATVIKIVNQLNGFTWPDTADAIQADKVLHAKVLAVLEAATGVEWEDKE